MITIEQKIEHFRRMVLGKASHDLEEKITLLDAKAQETIAQMKKELENTAAVHIEEHMTMAQQERKRRLAKAKLDKSHALLKAKEQFVKDVVEGLEEKAKVYRLEEAYVVKILKSLELCLKDIPKEEHIEIFISPADETLKGQIEKQFYGFNNWRFGIRVVDILGGFILETQTAGVRYDYSYLSKIKYAEVIQGSRAFELLEEDL